MATVSKRTIAKPPSGSNARAEKGSALAEYRLGTLYEKGLGVPLDTKIAADWYAKAAELGNVKAMHNLASPMPTATAATRTTPRLPRWFLSAAQRGLADSQFNLAVLHERGLGVQHFVDRGLYGGTRIAAAQGDMESTTRVEALLSQHPRPPTAMRPTSRRGVQAERQSMRQRNEAPRAFRPCSVSARVQGPEPVANPNSETEK
jgi:TPR repeat protein